MSVRSYNLRPIQSENGQVQAYMMTTYNVDGKIVRSKIINNEILDNFLKLIHNTEDQERNKDEAMKGNQIINKKRTNKDEAKNARNARTIQNTNNIQDGSNNNRNRTSNKRKGDNHQVTEVKDKTGFMQMAKTGVALGAGSTIGSMAIKGLVGTLFGGD